MKYTFINAVICSIPIKGTKKLATPMVGYILKDNDTNINMVYSRKEAYDLVQKYGAINVENKSRIDDYGEIQYYLKLKDTNLKINQFLINHVEIKCLYTTKYLFAVSNTLKKYGYTEEVESN